jgi:osomolarity two-component system response regulator SKN7
LTLATQVLEFKHPYFRIDSKDDLDNIRRKAPAPRKIQAPEDFTTNQHISVISEQLTATQQQVQQLQEAFSDVSQTNRLLVNEVITLQKMLNAQKQAQHEMLNYLTPYEGNHASNNIMSQPVNSNTNTSVPAAESDEAVPELRRARELLSSVSSNSVVDRELERLHGVYGSPADSNTMITPTSMPMMPDAMNDIARYPVYPVGQTVGIDPFHSDYINKIPFAMPSDLASAITQAETQSSHMAMAQPTTQPSTPLEKPSSSSMWGPKKPLVFLVEDDAVCSKIGVKFLTSMGCEVEHASNGADAYARCSDTGREAFDLIFMDIIMPKLDGVSATLYIRQHCPATPIIAMTSNIRPEDVNGYFEHGMNGVLAKPFTREGMLKAVRAHMSHLLKNPPGQESSMGGYFSLPNVPSMSTPGGLGGSTGNIKYESTPPNASAWSPGLPNDQAFNLMNGGGQFNLTPGGSRANYARIGSPSGRMSDHDSPPEKRQRLNPQHGY